MYKLKIFRGKNSRTIFICQDLQEVTETLKTELNANTFGELLEREKEANIKIFLKKVKGE